MNPLHVNVNETDILFNSLYENPDPAHLMHDLLAVELADGCCIDVGWYPQFDPAGRYKVSILDEDGSTVGTVFETRDVHEVVEAVEAMAKSYAGAAPSDLSSSERDRV